MCTLSQTLTYMNTNTHTPLTRLKPAKLAVIPESCSVPPLSLPPPLSGTLPCTRQLGGSKNPAEGKRPCMFGMIPA